MKELPITYPVRQESLRQSKCAREWGQKLWAGLCTLVPLLSVYVQYVIDYFWVNVHVKGDGWNQRAEHDASFGTTFTLESTWFPNLMLHMCRQSLLCRCLFAGREPDFPKDYIVSGRFLWRAYSLFGITESYDGFYSGALVRLFGQSIRLKTCFMVLDQPRST